MVHQGRMASALSIVALSLAALGVVAAGVNLGDATATGTARTTAPIVTRPAAQVVIPARISTAESLISLIAPPLADTSPALASRPQSVPAPGPSERSPGPTDPSPPSGPIVQLPETPLDPLVPALPDPVPGVVGTIGTVTETVTTATESLLDGTLDALLGSAESTDATEAGDESPASMLEPLLGDL